jgi:hypothetical protein
MDLTKRRFAAGRLANLWDPDTAECGGLRSSSRRRSLGAKIGECPNLLKMADTGCVEVLAQCFAGWNGVALHLHLFVNDYTPTTSDTIANYTEATFTGYALANITAWAAQATAAHVASIQAAAKTFTRTATGTTQNVYGYYVTKGDNTTLCWAERDPNAPIPLTNNGDSYTVTPRLTEQDLST